MVMPTKEGCEANITFAESCIRQAPVEGNALVISLKNFLHGMHGKLGQPQLLAPARKLLPGIVDAHDPESASMPVYFIGNLCPLSARTFVGNDNGSLLRIVDQGID